MTRLHSTPQWRRVRRHVLKRDGGHCRIRRSGCAHTGPGCPGCATDVDHIVRPKIGGAPYDPANLRPACGHCNRARGAEDQATENQRNAEIAASVRREEAGRYPGPSRVW